MGLMQAVRRFFGRTREDPARLIQYIPYVRELEIQLTVDEVLSLATVWACIDAIAKAIAKSRWDVYQPLGGGRKDVLEEDPLAWVLNTRANPEMTAIAFREAMLYIAIPFGNAYAEIVPDGAGRIAELWPLEHDRVTPRRMPYRRDAETGEGSGGELVYEYIQPDGAKVLLPQRRVFHLRGPSLNGFLGDNLVARAARSIATAVAAERYTSQYFGNSAEFQGIYKHPGKLSETGHKNLKADLEEKRKKKHGTIILEEGADYMAVSTDPQKSQLVESRQFSVEEICRWFGVPPHKVQHLLRSTFSNIEHQSIEFVRDALTPWERRLCQEADYKLFPQRRGPWRYTCIDLAPLTYGDAYSRAQAHAVWRQNGIMTANEIRAREGLNDAGPEGDVLLVQANLTTVSNILRPAAPAPRSLPPGEADDEMEMMEPGYEAGAAAAAREGMLLLATSALERYARRLENRRGDLARRHPPEQVQVLLNEERERVLIMMAAELARAGDLAVRAVGRRLVHADALRAFIALESGQPPARAAERMLAAAMAKPVHARSEDGLDEAGARQGPPDCRPPPPAGR